MAYWKKEEDDDTLDEFKIDYLDVLGKLFVDNEEEYSLQMFFNKPGETTKALVLVNCIWNDAEDGSAECTIGPYIVSGKNTDTITYIVPKIAGVPVIST